jgi:hypothetical protein
MVNRRFPLLPSPLRQPSRLAHAAMKAENLCQSILYFVCPYKLL